jgi:hypothetical protein
MVETISQFVGTTRIRRDGEIPSFVEEERTRAYRYSNRLAVTHERGAAVLCFRRSRWRWIAETEDGVRKREFFAWLVIGRKRVAAIKLCEYAPCPWLSNDELFLIMDTESSQESSLAEVLIDSWEQRFADDVTSRGNLVDLQMAWSDPVLCPPMLWAKATNLLLQQECKSRSILYGLQRRLDSEPMPKLFDSPIATWLPASNDGERDHSIEVGHLLDLALARSIRSTPALSAERLWRWLNNVRRHPFSNLKEETQKAVTAWLDLSPEQEILLFDEALKDDDIESGPWVVLNTYITTVRRQPSDALVSHLLNRARTNALRDRLLSILVEVVVNTRDLESYWAVYDEVVSTGNTALLAKMTTSTIENWRREQSTRAVRIDEQAERRRTKGIETLRPILPKMAVGMYPQNLDWAAHLLFERNGAASLQLIVDETNSETAASILAGWRYIATNGLGDVDATKLGIAEGEKRRYYVEAAAVAGVYRMLTDPLETPDFANTPLSVALAVLKSSWIANGQERQKKLNEWAVAKLDSDHENAAVLLVEFWTAATAAGEKDLSDVWKILDENAKSPSLHRALDILLATNHSIGPDALRTAVKAAARHIRKERLLHLARLALDVGELDGACRDIWNFVSLVLDPGGKHAQDAEALFSSESSTELLGALGSIAEVDLLPSHLKMIRALGPVTRPSAGWSSDDDDNLWRAGDKLRRVINELAIDPRDEAGAGLAKLAEEPALAGWRASLLHACAEHGRLTRDRNYKHPLASVVRDALHCGPPVNAMDLRTIVRAELHQLRDELRSTDTTPWKRYWNVDSEGKATSPLIENECRDHLLDRLRDRLQKYRIAAALPEARRGEETRADVLILTGAGRNLPIEAKRHFHPAIWTAAATQLQGYSAAPGADRMGIYLVFWFGNGASPTPARPDGEAGPNSGAELEAMLAEDLPAHLTGLTDIVVFDVSDPSASAARPRRRRPVRQSTG